MFEKMENKQLTKSLSDYSTVQLPITKHKNQLIKLGNRNQYPVNRSIHYSMIIRRLSAWCFRFDNIP